MKLQPREKGLLVGLLLVGCCSLAIVGQRALPLDLGDRTTSIERLEASLDERRKEWAEVRRELGQLRRWTKMSLPRDRSNRLEGYNAQRLYQTWLTDLATAAGFREVQVRPFPLQRDDDYLAIRMELGGQTRFADLCKLLTRFRTADLLQKVDSLEIRRLENDRVAVKLVAVGLVIKSADVGQRLLPHTTLTEAIGAEATDWQVADPAAFAHEPPFMVRIDREIIRVTGRSSGRLSGMRGQLGTAREAHAAGEMVEQFPDFLQVKTPTIAKSPFRRPQFNSPLAHEEILQPPASRYIFLVATIHSADSKQAWIYDRTINRQTVVVPGSKLAVGSESIRVADIVQDRLILEREGKRFHWKLGGNLEELERERSG